MSIVNAKKYSGKINFVQYVYFVSADQQSFSVNICAKLLKAIDTSVKNIV